MDVDGFLISSLNLSTIGGNLTDKMSASLEMSPLVGSHRIFNISQIKSCKSLRNIGSFL